MSHEQLIIALASEATPIAPLPAPRVRTVRWVMCALLFVGAGLLWRGVRANWAAAFSDPTFVVSNILLLGVALLAAWTALVLAVPGALRSPVAKWLPVAGLGGWGAILIQQVASVASPGAALMAEPIVTGCMWKTFGVAAGPAFLIILMAYRAAPLDWRWTGSLAALSALAFGAIGTEFMCPITGHAHLFNWHFLPVAAMTLVAFVAGAVLPRSSGASRRAP